MVDRKANKVQEMFGSIAPRYDMLNRVLSLSIDRYWRWKTCRRIAQHLESTARALDLCTGTGDLAIQLSSRTRVVGCDFVHGMLTRGLHKTRSRRLQDRVTFVEGDALRLPFNEASFDTVTIAFGLRNLENWLAGLTEMRRVLRSGGLLAVLEFSEPNLPVFRGVYRFYFTHILPRIGRLLSGQTGPYSYLPASVAEFPSPDKLNSMLLEAGFTEAQHHRFTGGVACLHIARV